MSAPAPTILLRIVRSRAVRKFSRNRMAMAALVVILVYLAVGIACMFGAISVREVSARVGPDAIPGWLEPQGPEKRLRDTAFYSKLIETAIKRSDPEAAIAAIELGERRAANLTVPEFKALAKEAEERYDEIGLDLFDEIASLRSQIRRAGMPDAAPKDLLDAAAIAAKEAEIVRLQALAEVKLAELEALTLRMIPMPDGFAGTMYRFRTFLGTDRQGRSISIRAIYSIRIALQVGIIVGLVAVGFGTLMGGAAAFFGGWVDHGVTWLYTTFSSIPQLVLLSLIAYVFLGVTFFDELIPVYAALSLTFWIGPCRVIRGEVMKIKELEYVQAATAIGFRRGYIMLRHVLPNTSHLMLINFSLLFIGAIKTEVILTFLGLGVKNGASWGIMIEQSRQEVINGFFWQIGAATALMFGLVLAFNIVSDALQDAFDPKHVG